VERWFGLLTDKQLRRGAHHSIQALEQDIRTWIEQWNTAPKPFAWTKTADEVLDRLASYLQRIPGAGHWVGQPLGLVVGFEEPSFGTRLRTEHAYCGPTA
jgi:hypothetical protein